MSTLSVSIHRQSHKLSFITVPVGFFLCGRVYLVGRRSQAAAAAAAGKLVLDTKELFA